MTVSEQIIQILNVLCAKFGVVIDWTSENVIPYVETLCGKLISWEVWSSVAWIGIMAVLSIISIIVVVKCRLFSSEVMEDLDLFGAFLIAGLLVLWFGTGICIATQIFDIIKCVTFPELYVFQYIQGCISSGS